MKTLVHKGAAYIAPLLKHETRLKATTQAVNTLRGFDFDAVACRGVSGLIAGTVVAMTLGKPLLVVRKPKDCSHSAYLVEGPLKVRYLIVDDCVSSGETVRQIRLAVKAQCPESRCVGVYLTEMGLSTARTGSYSFLITDKLT